MWKIIGLLASALCVLASHKALSATWYVDGSVSSSGDGTSWGTALKTIQEGIDEAVSGDIVLVGQGFYVEDVEFKGKNITLRCLDPLLPDNVEKTVIEGSVGFAGSENDTCVLTGFTIRYGSGISGNGTKASIQHNVITGHSASSGGGLRNCNGVIQNNVISDNVATNFGGGLYLCGGLIQDNEIVGNSAESGGGVYACDGTIEGNNIKENSATIGGGLASCGGTVRANTISRNSADTEGGGLLGCNGALEENSIDSNSVTGQNGKGGGLQDCEGEIRNNDIGGNSADYGAGLSDSDGPIEQNTITSNHAKYGGGLYNCGGHIANNTIRGNSAEESGGGLLKCGATIEYNTITANMANSGGGLADCDQTIRGNTIKENRASGGAGLSECDGNIEANVIVNNSNKTPFGGSGGGLRGCNGIIQRNLIAANKMIPVPGMAYGSTGGGLSECNGTIQSNVIAGNAVGGENAVGGGLYNCDGIIQSNTIVGNSASYFGGGLAVCKGTIVNCIIWGNSARDAPQLYLSSQPTYSCIQGPTGGRANTNMDPVFVDTDGPDDDEATYEDNDYSLASDSPCIDAGTNDVKSLPGKDYHGNRRVLWGGKSLRGDMGAYELDAGGPSIEVSKRPPENIVITWWSAAGMTYSILFSDDMMTWQVTSEDVPSMGDAVTIWIDPTTPLLLPEVQRRYYKITEKQHQPSTAVGMLLELSSWSKSN